MNPSRALRHWAVIWTPRFMAQVWAYVVTLEPNAMRMGLEDVTRQ